MDTPKVMHTPEPNVTSSHTVDAGSVELVIVDDNVDAADSLAALLTVKGYNTVTLYDASSTLIFSEKKSVQAFILDIGLPDMDGYELLKKLKPKAPNALFIALTGYEQSHDRTLSLTDGFDHYFVKPVNIEKLIRLLNLHKLTE